eukprot:tig00021357_g20774.t1
MATISMLETLLNDPASQTMVVQYIQANQETLADGFPALASILTSITIPDVLDETSVSGVMAAVFDAYNALSAEEQAAVQSDVQNALAQLSSLEQDDAAEGDVLECEFDLDLLDSDFAADEAAFADDAAADAAF